LGTAAGSAGGRLDGMQIRYMEGWLSRQLAAQPWVKTVVRFSEAGGPSPVGLTIAGINGQTAHVGMVLGASTSMLAHCDTEEGWAQDATGGPVDVAPNDQLGWCDAIATVVRESGHEHVAQVEPFPGNGQPGKNPGIKLFLTDGSSGYLTVLSVKR
jgi:hypothetical protein